METDDGVQADLPGSAANGSEPLACVTCRSRKLKCDRVKPACSRCLKVKGECVYPESRRKPAFKRKNVKELEERLAQVEDLLKEAANKGNGALPSEGDLDSRINIGMDDFHVDIETIMAMQNGTFDDGSSGFHTGVNMNKTAPPSQPEAPSFANASGELMGLGLSEALPPFEMMEELNKSFFERQQHFIPIIHPGRYLQAFYSAPHKRPPMCLQYAVWSMASNGHEKYSQYHDIFYKRARQYADADEMKGFGEHFLTIQHAQAWALIATDEARSLFFTRAAMSSAKCVRLVEMMGLHRIDGDGQEMAPTLAPPTSWVDLEERRRAFWGAYCIDCHASIATGWPTLIDPNEITTHLPSSEEAFNSAREEETSTLPEAFQGASYSTFAGAVIMCYIFNMLLKHVHWERPNDRPADVEYGEFWKRHRDIDNMLSSAFMFLPERFRLPQSMRDPTSVHTNLNLHASVICLHHAAIDRIERNKLPEPLKAASELRLRTAAEEVVSIIKLTSHMNSGYVSESHVRLEPGFGNAHALQKSPMVALSLYSAASVYVYSAKCNMDTGFSTADLQNLKFIINAMEAIGRRHIITQAFLQQIFMDIERNGLSGVIDLPNLAHYKNLFGWTSSNIPLLARTSISKHTEIQPPLPGRLPLGNPKGTAYEHYPIRVQHDGGCNTPVSMGGTNPMLGPTLGKFDQPIGMGPPSSSASIDTRDMGPNKRKRTSESTTTTSTKSPDVTGMAQGAAFAYPPVPVASGIDSVGGFGSGLLRGSGIIGPTAGTATFPVNLPHRSPAAGQPSPTSAFNKSTPSQSTGGSSSNNTPPGLVRGSTSSPDDGGTTQGAGGSGGGGGNVNEIIDITSIQNAMLGGGAVGSSSTSTSTTTWDSRGLQYAPSTDPVSFMNMNFDSIPPGMGIDPWTVLANMDDLTWTGDGEVSAGAATGGLNGNGTTG